MRRFLEVRTIAILERLWRPVPLWLREWLMRRVQTTYTVGVSAALIDDCRQVLFFRHRFRHDNAWLLPGGYVDKGERLDAAIRRELKEETGYDVEILALLRADFIRPRHLDILYLCHVTGGSLAVDGREIFDARFVAAEDLRQYLPGAQVQLIQQTLRETGSGQ